MRFLLGAFGDPGHAFPAIALGRGLVGRGHDVTVQTWSKWQPHVEREGMRFAAAPEYHVFPTRDRPLKPYQAVERAARETLPLVEEVRPDAVVHDIITLAPALAGELAGVPVATLIPHVDPRPAPGFPPYSMGARLPRSFAGRAVWDRLDHQVQNGLRRGRHELNETRARLGLPALAHVHGGISTSCVLVATFPQLEYPRPWPASTHVVGPLSWEQPFAEPVELAPGDAPLVLVAPSTVQDPGHRLVRAALEGLAGEDVRVLASTNRRPLPGAVTVPSNARLVDWISYSATMPLADVVLCHGGHGTVMRALENACAVVVCPAGGDMNENAARVDWAGVGVRLPRRLTRAQPVRLAVRKAVRDRSIRTRAAALSAWAASHDGASTAADVLEAWLGS